LESAIVLITAGAKLDNLTEDGYTPLDIAKLGGCLRIVKLLSYLEHNNKN